MAVQHPFNLSLPPVQTPPPLLLGFEKPSLPPMQPSLPPVPPSPPPTLNSSKPPLPQVQPSSPLLLNPEKPSLPPVPSSTLLLTGCRRAAGLRHSSVGGSQRGGSQWPATDERACQRAHRLARSGALSGVLVCH